MNRTRELLVEAADAYEDGRDPFSTDWLVEHNVTLDECRTLELGIAQSIRSVLVMSASLKDLVRSDRIGKLSQAVAEESLDSAKKFQDQMDKIHRNTSDGK